MSVPDPYELFKSATDALYRLGEDAYKEGWLLYIILGVVLFFVLIVWNII